MVFDLTDKIRDLSLYGDAAARKLEERLGGYIEQINSGNLNAIPKVLEFERNILSTCREELQFFDQQQLTDLNRLREDRHRCAHPSFQQVGIPYKPSAEQARLHLRNAVVHVFSQPPVQGKAALASVKTLIASQYFPESVEKAISQLARGGLENPTDPLTRAVLDALVFGFLTPDDVLYEKTQVVTALNALHEMFPGMFEDRLGRQLSKAISDIDDDRFMWVVYLVASTTRAWDLTDQPSRDKIERFVEEAPHTELSPAIGELATIEALRPALEARIQNFDLDELAEVVESPEVRNICKERAIELLGESMSWDRTNSVISRALLPLFEAVTPDDIETIVKLPEERGSDLIGAHGYKSLIDRVRSSGLMSEADLDAVLLAHGSDYLANQDNQV